MDLGEESEAHQPRPSCPVTRRNCKGLGSDPPIDFRGSERRIPGKGSKTNRYHLDGLIKEARPYAKEKLEERARRQKEDKARIGRKGRARLKLVQ